ncbi:SDR family NAD(P)-dependent oxidoreductase [Pedobacter rhizosphaerae]|uniref:Short-chain dehydrogenase n=1 Tax=Pedobacter rhizosphaerae TaxID=390241 RepID=A0A1H9PM07_9SPHI|nr:SDR family NAD(P)-dependent oxidoreductase [Pedobacter rhizosphaerae]SER49356.1 hypothetical protein SAMN04488023_11029 [Pedobacter rhizosphaerae]
MKKALITGASGGIGLEVAKRLAGYNYAITLVARNEQKLNHLLKELGSGSHQAILADLCNHDELRRLMEHIGSNDYDLLINNAGNGHYGEFLEIDLEDQLDTMRLNMEATVALSFSFLERATRGSALVNMGSLLGHSSLPGGAVYAATKSFVANFSESLWYEYKDRGIFIMGFNPGAADSEFHLNAGRSINDFPKFVVSSVSEVADELVAALKKRHKPRVVQGLKNRLMLFGFRFLSRAAAIKIMACISPGMPKVQNHVPFSTPL